MKNKILYGLLGVGLAALAWVLGVGDEVVWRTFVAPASVMTVGAGLAGPSLRGFNDTAHLNF